MYSVFLGLFLSIIVLSGGIHKDKRSDRQIHDYLEYVSESKKNDVATEVILQVGDKNTSIHLADARAEYSSKHTCIEHSAVTSSDSADIPSVSFCILL